MKVNSLNSATKASPPSSRNATLRFLGIFFGLISVFYALTLSPWVDANALFPVMKVSARGTSALLGLLGTKTTVEGVLVRGPACAVAVRRGCDPLEPIMLFAAAAIAFPTGWRKRLAGILCAVVLLFSLNLVRVASLYLLRANKSAVFESIHLVWWPAFFVAASLVLWILWLCWIRQPAPASLVAE
jgi:exosortase/archaeosortase family protein